MRNDYMGISGIRIEDLEASSSRYRIPDLFGEYIRSPTSEDFNREMHRRESLLFSEYLYNNTGTSMYYTRTTPPNKNRLRNFNDKFDQILKRRQQKNKTIYDWDWLRTQMGEVSGTMMRDNPYRSIRVSNLCPEIEAPIRPFSEGPIEPPSITADNFRFTPFQ